LSGDWRTFPAPRCATFTADELFGVVAMLQTLPWQCLYPHAQANLPVLMADMTETPESDLMSMMMILYQKLSKQVHR
jgi:hypothetical protein